MVRSPKFLREPPVFIGRKRTPDFDQVNDYWKVLKARSLLYPRLLEPLGPP
jgi:hypothetical protein